MKTVTAGILFRDGKVMLSRRSEGDEDGGLWEFPGGGVEKYETPDTGIARELMEETGIIARPLALFDALVSGKLLILFFVVEAEGDPQALDCAELKWVDCRELADYPTHKSDRAIMQRIAEHPEELAAYYGRGE